MPPDSDPAAIIRARSPWWTQRIGESFERLALRHFNAVRIAAWGQPQVTQGPLAICSNHPGWWDPITFVLLQRRFLSQLASYGPMASSAFRRYPFFAKIGIFGLDTASPQAGRQFMRIAQTIYQQPHSCLWVTGQGEFADVRTPLQLKAGLAHVAASVPGLTVLPLAIEYVFWQEKLPELLVAFGDPVTQAGTARDWQAQLTASLGAAMQRLATDAQSRDPARFVTLQEGRKGIGGLYDTVRRLIAHAKGERFQAGHMEQDARPPRENVSR